MTNKNWYLRFNIIATVVISAALVACDSTTLEAGNTLSHDGNSVALAYVTYMNNTIEATNIACQAGLFQNFMAQMQADKSHRLEANQSSLNSEIAVAKGCTDKYIVDANKKWAELANDAQHIANVYASLAQLTNGTNQATEQASLDQFVANVKDATGKMTNDHVKTALDDGVAALVGHFDAKGVIAFANHMQKIPTELAKTLTDNADVLDSIYSDYDHQLNNAAISAYRNGVGDPTPVLEQFLSKMNMRLNSSASQSPYLAAFAAASNRSNLSSNGKQARLKLIGLFQNLSAETTATINTKTLSTSLKDAEVDIQTLQKTITGILHPQSTSTTTK